MTKENFEEIELRDCMVEEVPEDFELASSMIENIIIVDEWKYVDAVCYLFKLSEKAIQYNDVERRQRIRLPFEMKEVESKANALIDLYHQRCVSTRGVFHKFKIIDIFLETCFPLTCGDIVNHKLVEAVKEQFKNKLQFEGQVKVGSMEVYDKTECIQWVPYLYNAIFCSDAESIGLEGCVLNDNEVVEGSLPHYEFLRNCYAHMSPPPKNAEELWNYVVQLFGSADTKPQGELANKAKLYIKKIGVWNKASGSIAWNKDELGKNAAASTTAKTLQNIFHNKIANSCQ